MRSWIILLVIAAVLAAAGGWYFLQHNGKSVAAYRQAEVKRGEVVASITATGALVPEESIDVGAQVNGLIATFGNDTSGKPVDYRSVVKQGMLLATIDDSVYATDVATAKAQLAQSNAQLKLAQANLVAAQAKFDQTDRDFKRSEQLIGGHMIAQADYDAAKSNYDQAKAQVGVNDATVDQAQATIDMAQAGVARAQRNLDYCTIKSPVDGVIIDKRVDIGQTVVSSMNAPSLFLIAKDLSKLLVLVQVNEADVGAVENVKDITFTVDKVPDHKFKGTVRKVRLNATMTQNVVTYTVEVSADNSQNLLWPYLTANVQFVTAKREDVLTVPNAALRFMPSSESAAPMVAAAGGGGGPTSGVGAPASRPTSRRSRESGGGGSGRWAATHGTVWVQNADGTLKSITVRTGLSDGAVTEVMGDGLTEGMQVIVAETSGTADAGGGGSPFAPRFGGGNRRRQ